MDLNKAIHFGQLVKTTYDIPSLHLTNSARKAFSLGLGPNGTAYEVIATIYGNDLATDVNPSRGKVLISVGLIVQAPATGDAVIALRGTEAITEWVQDAHFGTVACHFLANAGRTEDGFTAVYNSLKVGATEGTPHVAALLSALPWKLPVNSLTICGHSLGGALATLLALDLAANGSSPFNEPAVYTFASPRTGDRQFVQTYNKRVPNTSRITNRADGVPRRPPRSPYEHVLGRIELNPVEVKPPNSAVKIDPSCQHQLATYLYLLSLRAGGVVLPLDPACAAAGLETDTPKPTSEKDDLQLSQPQEPVHPSPLEALLPGFSPEDLAGQDLIGIGHDVNAFASVMAAENLNPPLAIGLFADWGSGKSFFMRKLKERIELIANAAHEAKQTSKRTAYCSRIVQIEFNAWHYVEGNLWASLVEHIFENLRISSKESEDLVEQRKKEALDNLELSKELKAKAQQKYNSAEASRKVAEGKVISAKKERDDVSSDLSKIVSRDVWHEVVIPRELKSKVDKAMDDLGLEQFPESARELYTAIGDTRTLLGRGRALLLSTFNAPGWWRRAILLMVIVLAVPVISWLTLHILDALNGRTIQDKDPISKAVQLASLVGGLAAWLRMQLKKASKALNVLESAGRRVDKQLDDARNQKQMKVVQLENELDNKSRELESANRLLAEAEQKVASAQAELDATTPTRILAEFIESRAASADYRRHLGIIALIRRDLETLTRLMRQRRAAHAGLNEDDPIGIDRIILYIDDLDRCPPKRVVQVLEAIHLLLAFDLFVVVVGVDSRWVERSLMEEYPLLSSDDTNSASSGPDSNHAEARVRASPLDYLEKIFQIPFWLRRMSPDVCGHLIEGLVGSGPIVPSQSSSARATPMLESTTHPEDADDEVLENSVDPQHLSSTFDLHNSFATSVDSAGSQVSNVALTKKIDLEPKSLQLQREEVEFMKTLTPILVRSPRAAKRFLNIYRIVRARLPSGQLSALTESRSEGTNHQAVMFLLSVITGAQPVSNDFFRCLFGQQRTATLGDLSRALESAPVASGSPEIRAVREWLREFEKGQGRSMTLGVLQDWAPYVTRYSFRMSLDPPTAAIT
jgi:Lipase (class 3)/KAP family P-loop domain